MREHSHEQAGLAGVDDHQKHGGGGAVFAAVEHHGELEDGQPDVDGDEGRQYDGRVSINNSSVNQFAVSHKCGAGPR